MNIDWDADQGQWLYRYYDAVGQLLYVGITTSRLARHRAHRTGSRWFPMAAEVHYFEVPGTRFDLEAAERAVILLEQPIFNKQHRDWRPVTASEPTARPENQRAMSTLEAALEFTVNQRTIKRWCKSGIVPTEGMIGGSYVIGPEGIAALHRITAGRSRVPNVSDAVLEFVMAHDVTDDEVQP